MKQLFLLDAHFSKLFNHFSQNSYHKGFVDRWDMILTHSTPDTSHEFFFSFINSVNMWST